MTASTAAPRREAMRRINDVVWQSIDDRECAAPVAFFCECAHRGCFQPVWLTASEYERVRDEPGWTALAPGHQPGSGVGE